MSWTGSHVELYLLTSSPSAMVSHPPPAPASATSMVALTHIDTPPSFLSVLPEQPQHNWIPPTPPAQPSDTLLPAQQPVGHAAASAAAAAVNGSLGGGSPQQLPASGAANADQGGSDPLTSQLAGMSKQQLYELLSQMKVTTPMPIHSRHTTPFTPLICFLNARWGGVASAGPHPNQPCTSESHLGGQPPADQGPLPGQTGMQEGPR